MLNTLLRNVAFRGGVHPPTHKDTATLAIRRFPFAPLLAVPLRQHIGNAAVPVVRVGQEVQRGQVIGEPDGFCSVAMHAPASGVVRRIDQVPSVLGHRLPGVYIEPFPGSTQEVAEGEACAPDDPPERIIEAIRRAGIVGLGGAAFPTHVKLSVPEGKRAELLVVNGIECEPYLTTDHRVMLEQSADVHAGVRYALRATGAGRAVIGVEANKRDAAEALRAAAPADLPVEVRVLPVKYPQGAEKMLITALTGRQIPSGALPIDVNVVTVNVATAAEIGRLLPHGRGILERVVTVGGPAVGRPGNYRMPIGTPLRFVLGQVEASEDLGGLFLGGPMMGQAVPDLDIPLTKGTSGIIAFRRQADRGATTVFPCIHCGRCVQACPMRLNPAQLVALARNGEHQRMAEEFNLMDCFECGSCSYVCPAHLPLVQRFRVAKAAVRKARTASS